MFTRLLGRGIKSMWPTFETEMLGYHLKAKLDEKISLGRTTRLVDPAIKGIHLFN